MTCSLCRNVVDDYTDIQDIIGTSGSTFSSVLQQLFKEEPPAPSVRKLDFSRGCLCPICKYFVYTLTRLEKEVNDVKCLIFTLFKNECSEVRNENLIDGPSAKETSRKHKTTEMTIDSSNETKSKVSGKKSPKKDKKVVQAPKPKKTTRQSSTPKNNNSRETTPGVKSAEPISKGDEVYYVEKLLEKRGYKYLVKWENYPKIWNSWEPRFALPQNIVKVKGFLNNFKLSLS